MHPPHRIKFFKELRVVPSRMYMLHIVGVTRMSGTVFDLFKVTLNSGIIIPPFWKIVNRHI